MYEDEDESSSSKPSAVDNLAQVLPDSIYSSAEQRALSNAVIIRNILAHVSPTDIINWRQVSKTFEEEATSNLRSNEAAKQKFHVKFTRKQAGSGSARASKQNRVTDHGCYEHVYMGSLWDFLDSCWISSRKFPVLNFAFENLGCETKDMLDFLQNAGKDIKGLYLNPSADSQHRRGSLQLLTSILFEKAPNLRNLTLVSTPWLSTDKLIHVDHSNVASLEPSTLALETLTLQGQGSTCSSEIVRDILASARNLKQVLDPTLKFTDVLTACHKFHLGSKVIDMEIGRDGIPRFSDFAVAGPGHLQELALDFALDFDDVRRWRVVGRALRKILESGGRSLVKIGKFPFLQLVPNIEPVPILEKVAEVQFYQQTPTVMATPILILPTGYSLLHVFPRLKTFRLFDLTTESFFNPVFQPRDAHYHSEVTTVELTPRDDGPGQQQWVGKLALLFPNIKTLEIGVEGRENLPEVVRAIWTHLQGLENLKILVKFGMSDRLEPNQLPGEMDSALTGIPPKLCQQLRRNVARRIHVAMETVDRWRQFPSILNLTRLKTFQIQCCPQSMMKKAEEQLFTTVSIDYAFRPMFERQKLRATFKAVEQISYGQKKGVFRVQMAETEFSILG